MRRTCLAAVLLVVACAGSPATTRPVPPARQVVGYTWTQVAPPGSGAFPQDWRAGKWPMTLIPVQAFGGELWMTAQTAAWSSADGLVWSRHDKRGDWGPVISVAYVYFRDRLWMYGGQRYTSTGPSTGKDEGAFLNDIWVSDDGTAWERAGQARWPARSSHGMVVFRDRLWLFGGATHVEPDGTPDQFLNDVWSSEDGVSWTQVTAAAPWSPRDHPRVVVFEDALYMLGGQAQSDVWSSPDGASWTRLTADAGFTGRRDYGVAVFKNRLWVFGGWDGVSTNAHNDVWSSPDGARWTREVEHAPWTERSGGHSVVFRDRLWIFSGKHTGAPDSWAGDIWTMTKSA